jgi:hypothetical protein
MANKTVQIDTVIECLTQKCSDCTGFYINRVFNHRLRCMHRCHRIKDKVLEGVSQPESNTTLRVPLTLNPEVKENDQ